MKERIIKKAEELGLKVRFDYSGRCMFGDSCIGVVGSLALLDRLVRSVRGASKGLRKDSMGLDYIYYWPAIS